MDVVVVDDNDEVIGTMPIDDAHRDGTPHQIAVVYVVNESGEILVQSRTDGFLDHSAAGHVDPGESYEVAAKRELEEELGISGVELTYVGHARTCNEKYPGKVVSHVFDIFKVLAKPVELQADEVEGVYWTDPRELLEDMKTGEKQYCEAFTKSLEVYLKETDSEQKAL